MVSEEQIKANKENAKLGGVKSEEGKQVSRLNALKFGFFSKIVTEYDKINQEEFCLEIYTCIGPNDTVEAQLVELLLSHLLSYRRICFVENELILKNLDPTITVTEHDPVESVFGKTIVKKKGYTPKIESQLIDDLEKFQRHKTSNLNAVLKILHEIERSQRMKKGEAITAPIPVDLNSNGNNNELGSF